MLPDLEVVIEEMVWKEWTKPEYSVQEVNKAGKILSSRQKPNWTELVEALTVVNNWRSSHSFPLNTFQVGLRQRSKPTTNDFLVAQRIKRLSSIRGKLRFFPKMKLSQMQDIGGCRSVLKNVGQVRKLVKSYIDSSLKHRLLAVDDYITYPKLSGYRGVHLIYRYYSDRKNTFNDLKIEVQIRSKLQHSWATAVETVGTFVNQALKSSQGEEEWLEFFALMGSAIAAREHSPTVPKTPSGRPLTSQLRSYANKLDVKNRLQAYGAAIRVLTGDASQRADYFLLSLNPTERSIGIVGYKRSELHTAARDYLDAEQKEGVDAVLVSVESLSALRKAYPNYFLDTTEFIRAMEKALQWEISGRKKTL